jgi:hypothetical protein
MPHTIEPATSGRARCRGCGQRIDKDELRLGERLPNPFAEGEMTLWFHVVCGAFMRPEPFLEALKETGATVEHADRLEAEANRGLAHRRLPRVKGAERAPTGRARCRSCREPIEKGGWRIPLVYYEEGRLNPSGFIHARCATGYFETSDIAERARHFSPDLTDEDLASLKDELEAKR